MKRKKSGCFFPDRSQNDKYDYITIIFPGIYIKFQGILSYEAAQERVAEILPELLKEKYNIEFSISYFYNTKHQTIFELSIKLTYKEYICD